MSEQTYKKVFEVIQDCLVPKTQLKASQNKILQLESMLEKVKTELEKVKAESTAQKVTIEIIQAEKDRLQGEKEILHAAKNAIEVKFKEVSLKLKQKTNQNDLLSKSQAASEQNNIVTSSTETRKVKKEPNGIGIVNTPTSLASKPNEGGSKAKSRSTTRTGIKRQNTTNDDSPNTDKKRKKVKKSNSRPQIVTSRKSSRNKPRISCDKCFDEWGCDIRWKYDGQPDHSHAPDPKQKIQIFSSFDDYRIHLCGTHYYQWNEVTETYRFPGDFDNENICEFCDCSFKSQKVLEEHILFEHLNPSCMTTKNGLEGLYDLYISKRAKSTSPLDVKKKDVQK